MDSRHYKRILRPLKQAARQIWHKLPLSYEKKATLKSILFSRLPLVFRWTQAYRSWYAMNHDAPHHWKLKGINANSRLSPSETADYYVPLLKAEAPNPNSLPVRLIAFYLPQFHPIKENDAWWGTGFTEWTNVRPARPQFMGHYQPHVPGELGYYNLLDKSVQKRQIELAKLYGVGGFCFYYYWFAGKRLLEKPIENYLADPELDHPFCLCWANENWSRRWDGKDSEILIAQEHSAEDDVAFAADVARYMRDSRYIRINGKPLLVVYRPSLLPSPSVTAARWREYFRSVNLGEVYLAYTQSFEAEDPSKYGFDAAIEFPPNNSAPPNITRNVQPLDSSFAGTVYDWSALAERSRHYKKPIYTLIRSVCPSWDNTARRKHKGTIFLNSTPPIYQEWLGNAVAETLRMAKSPDERLVFVNAWNEWAEGAHLEPDQKYGYAWLHATRKALTGESLEPVKERIAIVSHDAHPHGAQFLALGLIRSLAEDFKFEVHTVLLGEGRLKSKFEQFSRVHELLPGSNREKQAALAHELLSQGVHKAIVNTTVSGAIIEALTAAGITCISLIHEMPGVIESMGLQTQAKSIAKNAAKVIFPAPIVAAGFSKFAEVDEGKSVIRPQGLWRRNLLRYQKQETRNRVRAELGLSDDTPLILTVGYADHRKGIDLFARMGLEVLNERPNAVFVWIGHWDESLRPQVDRLISGHEQSFKFLGYQPETAAFHVAADIYALTSREDPFPNVVLESFDAGVPVVAFAGTGGGAELVSRVGGITVPAEDTPAFAKAVLELISQPEKAETMGNEASQLVDDQYSFRSYIFELCGHLGFEIPKISVVVPNFNYAKYITARLNSIIKQTVPIYELIILDDASTDDSVETITNWLQENHIECKMVVNQQNSGNVFDQWAKGVSMATGDFLWIAEADDLSGVHFLETVLTPMEHNPSVNLSYCESQQIDEAGFVMAIDYQEYRSDVSDEHWREPFIAEGSSEIINYLSVTNTIPNVSAVLFRSGPLKKVFDDHLDQIRTLRKAGDWLTYIKVLHTGSIAFNPRPQNMHRRHGGSVIGRSQDELMKEIEQVQHIVASDYPLESSTIHKAEEYLRLITHSANNKS